MKKKQNCYFTRLRPCVVARAQMQLPAALLLLALALALGAVHARPALQYARSKPAPPTFTTSSKVVPGAINVHIQPHSHLDLGWLKTFDEYLVGRNNSLQQGGVRWVYDSVTTALLRDPNRRFITVEMGFLMRWLDTQPEAVRANVQLLVAQDRLQVVNGGWAMHDEATVLYQDAVDQMSLGARLVNATFGAAASARVAWSIDPFGHANTQGVLTAQMGQAGFFYGRLDWQDSANQIATNTTEYVWRPSASLGADAQVFAGANVHGYDPPVLTDSGHPIFECVRLRCRCCGGWGRAAHRSRSTNFTPLARAAGGTSLQTTPRTPRWSLGRCSPSPTLTATTWTRTLQPRWRWRSARRPTCCPTRLTARSTLRGSLARTLTTPRQRCGSRRLTALCTL